MVLHPLGVVYTSLWQSSMEKFNRHWSRIGEVSVVSLIPKSYLCSLTTLTVMERK